MYFVARVANKHGQRKKAEKNLFSALAGKSFLA